MLVLGKYYLYLIAGLKLIILFKVIPVLWTLITLLSVDCGDSKSC